jgi:hypothetical protein
LIAIDPTKPKMKDNDKEQRALSSEDDVNKESKASRPEVVNEQANVEGERPIGRGFFYIEGLVGCIMMILCVVFTSFIELVAAIIYLVASAFHYLTLLGETGIFKVILLVVVYQLMVADAVLLWASFTVTETVGALTVTLTAIFGGCESGEKWHLYIRKMCHLTRLAFRKFHENWPLERVPLEPGRTDEPDNTEEPQSGPPPQPVQVDHEMGFPPQAEQLHVADEEDIVVDAQPVQVDHEMGFPPQAEQLHVADEEDIVVDAAEPVQVDHEMGFPTQAEQLDVADEEEIVVDAYEVSFTNENKMPATT